MPFRPLDPGWIKSQDPDPGSGMNNPDHIWIRDRKKFDLGSGKTSRIRNTGFGNPLSSCYTRTTTYAGRTDSLEILHSLKV